MALSNFGTTAARRGVSISRLQDCGVDEDEGPDQEPNQHLAVRSRCRKEGLHDRADLGIDLMAEQHDRKGRRWRDERWGLISSGTDRGGMCDTGMVAVFQAGVESTKAVTRSTMAETWPAVRPR